MESTPEYQGLLSVHLYSALGLPPATAQSEPAVSVRRKTALSKVISRKEREKLRYFEARLPGNKKLQQEALLLSQEDWLISDRPEPPLETGVDQNRPNMRSRFDAYFSQERPHACHWTVYGNKCPHTAQSRRRALGHARFHFDYRPFHCGAECGSTDW
jgi:hypothetical protein